MAVNNATVLDQIRLAATNDYQQRIPSATQAGIAAAQKALFDPLNSNLLYNDFIPLLNRIGLTIVRNSMWENPLEQFKREPLQFGSTIQEIGLKLLRAHGYDDRNQADLFEFAPPEVVSVYHQAAPARVYPVTINEAELAQAFTSPNGLAEFAAAVLALPLRSDRYDEYQIMKQTIANHDANVGNLRRIKTDDVDDLDASRTSTENFIKKIRATALQMQVAPSAEWNSAGLPIHAGELVLFTTPNVVANIDVNVLASAFNVSYADLNQTVITLDQIPIPGATAFMCSRDFFIFSDVWFKTKSFENGASLDVNHWLHHKAVYATSPMMPAALFTSANVQNNPIVVTTAPTALALSVKDQDGNTVATGATVNTSTKTLTISANLTGTVTPANPNVAVLPDAANYLITIDNEDIRLTTRTYVDTKGVVHLQKNIPAGTEVTITAVSTYNNPNGATGTYAATFVFETA